MTKLELTIKGDLEILRLEPGDVVVCTIHDDRGLTAELAGRIVDQLEQKFRGHQIVLSAGMHLSVARRIPPKGDGFETSTRRVS